MTAPDQTKVGGEARPPFYGCFCIACIRRLAEAA
jgi:hypothetical protein